MFSKTRGNSVSLSARTGLMKALTDYAFFHNKFIEILHPVFFFYF